MGNSLYQFKQNSQDNLATVLNNVFDDRNADNGRINENWIWTIINNSNTDFYNRLFGELACLEWVELCNQMDQLFEEMHVLTIYASSCMHIMGLSGVYLETGAGPKGLPGMSGACGGGFPVLFL